MQSRSYVRTVAIVFSILGLVVALLIHFIVLSSPRYNWLGEPAALIEQVNLGVTYLRALL
ncbi:MAG: light-harvesting protein [Chloroflexaceae bacterium]|nr:light-harvesting protein [Chloroflexaceae bacterium]NJL33770.1 light-harvesting protein [Chloroflexaceae bacterium]NJO06114.1 light-harvesting protein [Chloroflexaceae bacterium]